MTCSDVTKDISLFALYPKNLASALGMHSSHKFLNVYKPVNIYTKEHFQNELFCIEWDVKP